MYLFFIILGGLFLRLINIIKPEGLWNDEYVSWYVASAPFKEGFWNEVISQCHMPLYYLYLKPFSHFSDTILRFTSVVPSLISIYVMYLVGKEYSKKVGYFCALLTSSLTFLVYYAQEVRFYSLLFLFASLLMLYTIRTVKNPSKTNWAFYILFSLLILFTHHLGIIFVFFNTIYLLYKTKDLKKYLNYLGQNKLIFILLLVSFVIFAFLSLSILKQIPSSQWWGKFSYTNILFLFSDYFSPVLTNHVNAPSVFFYNKVFVIKAILPLFIALIGMFFGIKNYKGYTSVAALYVVILSVLAIMGKLVFITKYSIEILPILILLVAVGFSRIKKVGLVLITLLILFHVYYAFTPSYPTKFQRTEGNALPCKILNEAKPDVILFTYYSPERFDRYLSKDLTSKKIHISKINRFEYLENPQKILENVKKGERVSIVFLNSVSFISPEQIESARKINFPEMFITFSEIRNKLVLELDKNYLDFVVQKAGDWLVITCRCK